MSTKVPAPLYGYSRIHGFRPINPEPGEPKSGGGLMSKLDRLLHRGSISSSTPTDSPTSTVENPETPSPAITNDSQPKEQGPSSSLRILTWNVWFEILLKQQRTSALIATIKSLTPLPDVCCFQECTSGFEQQLEGDDWWRKTWAMTKCADQFAVTGFHYATMVFVRRELLGKMEFKAKTWFEPFGISQTGRGLLVVELTPPKSKHPVGDCCSGLSVHPLITKSLRSRSRLRPLTWITLPESARPNSPQPYPTFRSRPQAYSAVIPTSIPTENSNSSVPLATSIHGSRRTQISHIRPTSVRSE